VYHPLRGGGGGAPPAYPDTCPSSGGLSKTASDPQSGSERPSKSYRHDGVNSHGPALCSTLSDSRALFWRVVLGVIFVLASGWGVTGNYIRRVRAEHAFAPLRSRTRTTH
jgi:hypothetical protein